MVNTEDFLHSLNCKGDILHSTDEILSWIDGLKDETYVNIKECRIDSGDFWFFDDFNGEIVNRKRSFFSIKGARYFDGSHLLYEQPLIIQPEIGYLGILCKKFNGILHFLMQAKIEPGNVNCIQISPTIQATKSNFLRAHGGKLPLYFDIFDHSCDYEIIYDQIQSEQSSRFFQKRNRNLIICTEEDVECFPNYCWMTLGQIKDLMSVDNLINMDTRTVLSGIPVFGDCHQDDDRFKKYFSDECLYRSVFSEDSDNQLCSVFNKLNQKKMFNNRYVSFIPLNQLQDWEINETGMVCKKDCDFSVGYYDIEISGREVRHWQQPLFKANHSQVFGLLTAVRNGKRMYLVQLISQIGTVDHAELAPSIFKDHSFDPAVDEISRLFYKRLAEKKGILTDVMLSEEGGRFFHEQNRNVIMEIDDSELAIPDEYIWVDYLTLERLIQTTGTVNIQLRSLFSLIRL